MDLLSRFLSLMPVSGRVDVRCHFGAPWAIEEGPAGVREIPYHVLLSGRAVLEDGNGPPEHLAAGDIIVFPTGSPHRIHDGSGAPPVPVTERRNIMLSVAENSGTGDTVDILCGRFLLGAVPDRLLRDHLPSRLVVRSGARTTSNGDAAANGEQPGGVAGSRLARLIQLMREEATDECPGSETLVNHLSAALFALTLRFASEAAHPPHGLLALAGRPRLQAALSAMFESPGKPWTLDQFAALCNMSRATFVRQFQEAIGRSATDVLTEVRMTIAGRMLLESTTPVGDIGETVGYQSEAAFQRVFKKQIGVTPARWRASGGPMQPAQEAAAADAAADAEQ
ncbi:MULTISPECIES: AraC family transcriptional regulator [Paraburkholderia]|jgi:AraC family transcriptional activator of mtrCDE|uniref:AraC family transcriptional regulator n=1 Tax=Paraburkholderia TaxID=1822464 RepID=UPI00071EE2C9|nr:MULTISPECIES: AraC family transcriptional regulator [Paraburkholderia]ALP64384.1 AraC family transcriptional regulator [Paraburkholderia caribensis]AUT54475.1 AraC family transcriptional regulator [Paraburkholderia caribensis]MDR6385583.1 AraC family transcriptional activator of mtrCDE [Paraburkholderia caribensis]